MKIPTTNINVTVRGLLPLVCIVGAIIVAASGNDGWGWLLIVALLVS